MTIVTALVVDCPFASVAAAVKVDVPAVVGTPDSTPVAPLRVSPDGAVPAGMDQVSGAAPPVTVNVVL